MEERRFQLVITTVSKDTSKVVTTDACQPTFSSIREINDFIEHLDEEFAHTYFNYTYEIREIEVEE